MTEQPQTMTPGDWTWGEDADNIVYNPDEEYSWEINGEAVKYADTMLISEDGTPIIPIRIDHYEMVFDGDYPCKADRDAISAVPDLIREMQSLMRSYEIIAVRLGYKAALMRPYFNARAALAKAGVEI